MLLLLILTVLLPIRAVPVRLEVSWQLHSGLLRRAKVPLVMPEQVRPHFLPQVGVDTAKIDPSIHLRFEVLLCVQQSYRMISLYYVST